MNKLLDSFLGATIGTMAGDMLGRPLEGLSTSAVKSLYPNGIKGIKNSSNVYRFGYSDDTEEMILLIESILEVGDVDTKHYAEHLAANFNPKRGYSRSMQALLNSFKDKGYSRDMALTFLGFRAPGGSYGNGAIMRIAPIGLYTYKDIEKIKLNAEKCSNATHTHQYAVDFSKIMAVIISKLVTMESRDDLDVSDLLSVFCIGEDRKIFDLMSKKIEYCWLNGISLEEAAKTLGYGLNVSCQDTFPICLFSLLQSTNFESAVLPLINLGGDADTTGAIAGAMAGALYGYSNIPKYLANALEGDDHDINDGRGLGHLINITKGLYDLSSSVEA